ncbi:hypothetical protein GCM10010345_74230 [Streptomyces canarius]|uniref:Uncharacterized protein n=1 Tax=Streptomyces canarius TaxID=285453 RepID=A0ABQ3D4Z7_9ACTN|nr:hypothetical protein GCM10010345_74230 [Streptomyces canarius]
MTHPPNRWRRAHGPTQLPQRTRHLTSPPVRPGAVGIDLPVRVEGDTRLGPWSVRSAAG